MLSFLVAKFSHEKGYICEASYAEIIAGWHEAADGPHRAATMQAKLCHAKHDFR